MDTVLAARVPEEVSSLEQAIIATKAQIRAHEEALKAGEPAMLHTSSLKKYLAMLKGLVKDLFMLKREYSLLLDRQEVVSLGNAHLAIVSDAVKKHFSDVADYDARHQGMVRDIIEQLQKLMDGDE
jgi:hypothetical protein